MKNSDYVLRFEVSHRATLKRTILTPILHSSFKNCVSAIFHFSLFTLHFSLFTFHFSLKKNPPVIRHITSGYRGHFYLVLETNVSIIISIHDDISLSGHIAIEQ